jgi:hypothetical protein
LTRSGHFCSVGKWMRSVCVPISFRAPAWAGAISGLEFQCLPPDRRYRGQQWLQRRCYLEVAGRRTVLIQGRPEKAAGGLKIACFRNGPVRPGYGRLALASEGRESKLLFHQRNKQIVAGRTLFIPFQLPLSPMRVSRKSGRLMRICRCIRTRRGEKASC